MTYNKIESRRHNYTMLHLPNDIFAILFSHLSLDKIRDISYMNKDFLARINTFSSHVKRVTLMRTPIKCATGFLARTYPRHIIIGRDMSATVPPETDILTVDVPDVIMHRATRITVEYGFHLYIHRDTLKYITRLKLMNSRGSLYYDEDDDNEWIPYAVKRLTCRNLSLNNFAIERVLCNSSITHFKYYLSETETYIIWFERKELVDHITVVGDKCIQTPNIIWTPLNGRRVTLVRCVITESFPLNNTRTLILHDTIFNAPCNHIPALRKVILSGNSEFNTSDGSSHDRYKFVKPGPKLLAKLIRKASRVPQ